MTAPDATTTTHPDTLAPDATLEALASGAVVRWWQTTAFLRVAGPDAATLLDGLCTQAVERIEPGQAVLGLFLDAKAKVIAPTVLHRVEDGSWADPRTAESIPDSPELLLETLPDLVEPLRRHLVKYRLRAKVTIEAIDLSTIALVGAAAAGDGAATLDALDAQGAWTTVRDQARPTRAFLGSPDACAAQVAAAGERDVVPADPDAVEADRIEHGIAGLHDLLPGRMPAEVGGMASAVALDAGCYLGQEPVARLHYRGHANRTLRRLRADGDVAPAPAPTGEDGAPDLDAALALHRLGDAPDARAVGRLTTWARHPDGGTVALAVLRRELAAGETVVLAGTTVELIVADDPADS
jgi:folate-binding protein YgfZ